MESSIVEASGHAPAAQAEVENGIYVYSIIECEEPRTFGKIGIGGHGDDVYTVHYKDLAAVVSRTPLVVYDPTRENVLAHEHVNEVIIEEGFTPVPMSFGTLFKTEKDIVEFLEDTYDALRDVLVKIESGDPSWESDVPPPIVQIIKLGKLFGYREGAPPVRVSEVPPTTAPGRRSAGCRTAPTDPERWWRAPCPSPRGRRRGDRWRRGAA